MNDPQRERRRPAELPLAALAAGLALSAASRSAEAQPPPAPQPSPYGSMQAGGLEPPPPMPPAGEAPLMPPGSPTEQRLDVAKEKDSGRSLEWFYLGFEGGFEHVGLTTFEADVQNFTAGLIESTASGAYAGAFLGARIVFVTLGARARYGFLSAYDKLSLGGELGLHLPLGKVEPHVELGAGYVRFDGFRGSLGDDVESFDIRGAYGRISGGLDFYVTEVFSIGGIASWELLGLTRPGLGPDEIAGVRDLPPEQQAEQALALEGTSYGSGFAIGGVLGLHF